MRPDMMRIKLLQMDGISGRLLMTFDDNNNVHDLTRDVRTMFGLLFVVAVHQLGG